ncbi:TPA: methyltransferase domain-containing protein [Streptococcus pneumoniae]|nr:methyltransferase domain-containing protein [Streptococcus pneumoniae]
MSEAGHKFLAKLGKKRLRPGGKRATDWLIAEGGFSKEKRILDQDASFDIVINEAMLTMQADQAKKKCVMEYLRVLKPGGLLLTHDVLLKEAKESIRQELSQAIHVNVGPLTQDGWEQVMIESGYCDVKALTGEMTLMKLSGMIYDEGLLGTLKICVNACKKENRKQFLTMYKMFAKNKQKLGFIAMASYKSSKR